MPVRYTNGELLNVKTGGAQGYFNVSGPNVLTILGILSALFGGPSDTVLN